MKNNDINSLTKLVMDLAREKGFGTQLDEINVWEKIALIHSEVSEAAEGYRKKNLHGAGGLAEELADAIIRILQLAGIFSFDMEKEILNKLKVDKERNWDWQNLNETHNQKNVQ